MRNQVLNSALYSEQRNEYRRLSLKVGIIKLNISIAQQIVYTMRLQCWIYGMSLISFYVMNWNGISACPYQNAKCTFKIEAAGVSLLDKLNKGNCRYGESLKIYAIIQWYHILSTAYNHTTLTKRAGGVIPLSLIKPSHSNNSDAKFTTAILKRFRTLV